MRALLSHFQVTPKNAVAFLLAFAVYVQNLGHLPETPRQWGVAVAGFLLSTLVPARDPDANRNPALAASPLPSAGASPAAESPRTVDPKP